MRSFAQFGQNPTIVLQWLGAEQGTSFIFSFTTQNAQTQNMVCGCFALVAAGGEGGQSILHHQGFVTSNLTYSFCSSFLLHSEWTTKRRPHTARFEAAVGTNHVWVALCYAMTLLSVCMGICPSGQLLLFSAVILFGLRGLYVVVIQLTGAIRAETIKTSSIRFCIWKTVREFKMARMLAKNSFLHPS